MTARQFALKAPAAIFFILMKLLYNHGRCTMFISLRQSQAHSARTASFAPSHSCNPLLARKWETLGHLKLPLSQMRCYLSASKPLKVILDIRYPYAIMASLSRHCPSVPSELCVPATRSFPLPQGLCALSFHVLAHQSRAKLL